MNNRPKSIIPDGTLYDEFGSPMFHVENGLIKTIKTRMLEESNMDRTSKFVIPGGVVTGQDIENVLAALRHDKQAAAYALDTINLEHRTNQQSFMRVFVYPLLCLWARRYENKEYDDRNAATVTFSRAAVLPDASGFPYI